ncbi:HR-like lesion-inducer [Corchorus olitorius]|uniref:HR-like lesion-inducer n=1 Tax=Corchorus olitorius TaxID=93759 RepID=A0A1R3JLA0_9ROSI|nr:HR-like lesion-inducer [Corchorus olitorius]
MGFVSFAGRVFFASIFILSARQMFNEYGVDGGPAAKELMPKLELAKNHISSLLNVDLPDIEVKHIVGAFIALKGLGGILFVFGHGFGAFLLAGYLAISTPILHDFYNYKPNNPQYYNLLGECLQCVAQFGAILFFWGMKNSMPKRQLKKRAPKPKAA